MSDDYRVKPRSNLEVRKLAKQARDFFGVSKQHRVNVLEILKSKNIWTVFGQKELIFHVRPDLDMGANDGLTCHVPGVVTIAIKQSVHDAAVVGEGRARNTAAHELGHAVMHDKPLLARRADGNVTSAWIRTFESAEHQAKVFAAAFLINDVIARTFSSAEDISIEFGVSFQSATIYLEELADLHEREKIGEQIRKLAADLRASQNPAPFKTHYLKDLCTVCRNATIFPVGAKFMCQTCDTVFDQFQDGDTLDP